MADIADVLAQAENVENRRTATVRILLRQDLARRHADMLAELERVVAADDAENRIPQAPALAERIGELEAEIDDAKVTFEFRAIGRRRWVDLIAAHPPTKAQQKQVADMSTDPLRKQSLDFNPDTFPVAAIAASCIDPEMSEDDVRRLESAMSDSQWSTLWAKAIEVNIGSTDPKASRAAGMIRRLNERSDSTAVPEASDDPTS